MSKLLRITLNSGIQIVGTKTSRPTSKGLVPSPEAIHILTMRPKVEKRYTDKNFKLLSEVMSNGEAKIAYLSNAYKEFEVAKSTVCTIYPSTIAKIENL